MIKNFARSYYYGAGVETVGSNEFDDLQKIIQNRVEGYVYFSPDVMVSKIAKEFPTWTWKTLSMPLTKKFVDILKKELEPVLELESDEDWDDYSFEFEGLGSRRRRIDVYTIQDTEKQTIYLVGIHLKPVELEGKLVYGVEVYTGYPYLGTTKVASGSPISKVRELLIDRYPPTLFVLKTIGGSFIPEQGFWENAQKQEILQKVTTADQILVFVMFGPAPEATEQVDFAADDSHQMAKNYMTDEEFMTIPSISHFFPDADEEEDSYDD